MVGIRRITEFKERKRKEKERLEIKALLEKDTNMLVKDAFLVFLEKFQNKAPANYQKIKIIIQNFITITSDFINGKNDETMKFLISTVMVGFIANHFVSKDEELAQIKIELDDLLDRLLEVQSLGEQQRKYAKMELLIPSIVNYDELDEKEEVNQEELNKPAIPKNKKK